MNAAHLREAIARLREGTYQAGESHVVYYQDASTVRDVADLYAILKEEAASGSPNVENELARAFVQSVQSGLLLSDVQLAKLLELKKRYAGQLAAYRESSDRTQDILNVPDGANARVLK